MLELDDARWSAAAIAERLRAEGHTSAEGITRHSVAGTIRRQRKNARRHTWATIALAKSNCQELWIGDLRSGGGVLLGGVGVGLVGGPFLEFAVDEHRSIGGRWPEELGPETQKTTKPRPSVSISCPDQRPAAYLAATPTQPKLIGEA